MQENDQSQSQKRKDEATTASGSPSSKTCHSHVSKRGSTTKQKQTSKILKQQDGASSETSNDTLQLTRLAFDVDQAHILAIKEYDGSVLHFFVKKNIKDLRLPTKARVVKIVVYVEDLSNETKKEKVTDQKQTSSTTPA